jgi:predicted nucleotidyltransferase
MKFPTETHERVAELFAGFCENRTLVDTVLVVNSCARGGATAQSDPDMAVLVDARTSAPEIAKLEASTFSTVHLFRRYGMKAVDRIRSN